MELHLNDDGLKKFIDSFGKISYIINSAILLNIQMSRPG